MASPDSGDMTLWQRVSKEVGLTTLYHSTNDVKLLCMQRFVRLFAYGSATLIFVAFLEALNFSKTETGLFMTLTLVGDICISFVLTIFADAIGRKLVLVTGAVLMVGSGVVFARFDNHWVLLVAAILGVISPNGGEIGPFKAVEDAIIAHQTRPDARADIYAWYSTFGAIGTACGMMSTGWVMYKLIEESQWSTLQAYRIVFYAYAAIGAIKMVFAMMLSHAVELEHVPPKKAKASQPRTPDENTEVSPLLGNGNTQDAEASEAQVTRRRWLPNISKASMIVIGELSLLYGINAFATGLTPMSWMAFFFHSQYGMDNGALGSVFFATRIIGAVSVLMSAPISRRLGNVKTMVFTHLPSSVFTALIPVPNEVHWSLVLLILRACTVSMMMAPRSAFLATMIDPTERTAVIGAVNVVKTTAQSMGPLITGVLADRNLLWLAFVTSGVLKVGHDLCMLYVFTHVEKEREKLERERLASQEAERAESRIE